MILSGSLVIVYHGSLPMYAWSGAVGAEASFYHAVAAA